MFINNFILETKGKKGKKERRIYTWDLQFTDLASYAHDYAVLTYCVVMSYRRHDSFLSKKSTPCHDYGWHLRDSSEDL